MYLCTVLRSSPTCRAIADTLTPCRCNSRIIAISRSLTNDAPLCVKGTIIGHPSPTAPQAPMLRQLTWGKFSRHIWGVFGQRSHEEKDIFGDGVNIAARLEALAEPGGVCVSGVVRDQISDKLPYPFEDMGEQNVKNIARPVRVYALGPEAISALPASSAPP